jgi:hypothetical protein
MNPEIAGELLVSALPFITAGTAYVLTIAGIFLSSRYRNNKLAQALVLLDKIVIDVVKELNQTTVDELKKARSDGKLTPDEAEQIKHKAIDLILTRLGINLIRELQRALGPVIALIGSKIEATVHDSKKSLKPGTHRKSPASLSTNQPVRLVGR